MRVHIVNDLHEIAVEKFEGFVAETAWLYFYELKK
jgi:hypothetical protein